MPNACVLRNGRGVCVMFGVGFFFFFMLYPVIKQASSVRFVADTSISSSVRNENSHIHSETSFLL